MVSDLTDLHIDHCVILLMHSDPQALLGKIFQTLALGEVVALSPEKLKLIPLYFPEITISIGYSAHPIDIEPVT